jgi:GAF domain-containing protein
MTGEPATTGDAGRITIRSVDVTLREALPALGRAAREACAAAGPEEALRCLTAMAPALLGDKEAHLRPGGLKFGERQFSVCGMFAVTPDARHHLLVAEVGFPTEQHRLRIDIGLAHPGWVFKHRKPLILANTDLDADFKQILKTARMGSALYAPMIWKGELLGQLVLASQARNTYAQVDLDVLVTFAQVSAALWIAHDGPSFLRGLE